MSHTDANTVLTLLYSQKAQTPAIQAAIKEITRLVDEISHIKQIEFPRRVKNVTEAIKKDREAIRAERDEYKTVLQYIANPIKAMREECDKQGMIFNGAMATVIADNVYHSRDKAKQVLDRYEYLEQQKIESQAKSVST